MKAFSFTGIPSFIAIAGFSFLVSCKEEAIIAPNLIPNVDNINTFELDESSLTIDYKIKLWDSFITNDASVPIAGAGSMTADPFYGDVDNELYFQVTIPSLGFSFPDADKIDSAFVSLPYSRITYGDSNAVSNFDLFLVNDVSFKSDPTSIKYYNYSEINTGSNSIGNYAGTVHSLNTDTVIYPNKDTLINQLRFRLNSSVVDYLKTMTASNTANNSAFINFLNGFCVRPNMTIPASARKSLHYFILEPTNAANNFRKARMEVFYRDSANITRAVSFPFDKRYSAFYTKVNKNYSGYPAADYATEGKMTDSLLLTGGPGFKTDITIGNLSFIPKSVINLGRITVKIPRNTHPYLPPDLLSVTGIDDVGNEIKLADYGISGTDSNPLSDLAKKFVGGYRIEKKIDGMDYWVYEINIPRSLQKAVHEGKNSLSLRLNAYTIYPGAYRMVVPAKVGLPEQGVSYSIIYTKI